MGVASISSNAASVSSSTPAKNAMVASALSNHAETAPCSSNCPILNSCSFLGFLPLRFSSNHTWKPFGKIHIRSGQPHEPIGVNLIQSTWWSVHHLSTLFSSCASSWDICLRFLCYMDKIYSTIQASWGRAEEAAPCLSFVPTYTCRS